MDPSDGPKWYEEWFDRDEYEIVYSHRDEEEARKAIDLIERVLRPAAGDKILDIGCGRGRHAITLAQRGYRVTGVDLSEPSIADARKRASEEHLDVDFRVGDMREPVCDACFDGVVNLFTAFGYFDTDAEHQRAIQSISIALAPGGWFFQDFMNPTYVRANLVHEDSRVKDGVEIVQRRALRGGRIHKEIVLRSNGTEQRFSESVRLLELDDFRKLYGAVGLAIHTLFGNYDGNPFEDSSPRMIIVSNKR